MDDLFGDPLIAHAPLASNFEANDSFDSATQLEEGRYDIEGTGIDWYRFEAQAGPIDITMTPTAEPLTLNMVLHNANGAPIRAGFTPSGAETISFHAGASAVYYLKINDARHGDAPPAGSTLSYRLDLDLPQVVAPDGNNSMGTAQTLTEGTRDVLGREIDWYRFDTPSGEITLRMDEVQLLADPDDMRDDPKNLNLVLHNAQGQAIRAAFSSSTSETVTFMVPKEGTYYAKVSTAQFGANAPDGTVLSYRLTLDLPEQVVSDGNDSLATAKLLSEGSHQFSGTGVDWFRIDSRPGMMQFEMTPLAAGAGQAANLDFVLYDGKGAPVRSNIAGSGPESFTQASSLGGTYYLKVYDPVYPNGAPNGVTLDYRLDIDLPDHSWAVPLDFGPVRNASVAVYDIDNDGKDEIFVGTSKTLDARGNEVRPAGLIVLEDDGTVKWTKTFAASPQRSVVTGKFYETTSVSTAPTFSDVNDDGRIDILVGVGADNRSEFGAVSQPGDMGGLYALDADGKELWFHKTRDSFGDDGRSDGVHGAPRVFDIDADGKREVLVQSWDHYLYILDGRTGAVEREMNLHDTAGATPAVADLNGDGYFEIIAPADITTNLDAGLPQQGGILHVMSSYGAQNIPGWNEQVFDSTGVDFRGKFEPQAIWSHPKTVDLDGDGTLEIVLGTGNYFQDARGQYIKIWNADGSLRAQLDTEGRTVASPLIVDLDGDGRNEIVAATITGRVHAWNASGQELFTTHVLPYHVAPGTDLPIGRQPIAVDIDGKDGDLEILVTIGSQMVVLDSDGRQLSSLDQAEHVFFTYAGSPVARDIDGDGRLDLISGGTTDSNDQAVIFRWDNIFSDQSGEVRTGAYQNQQQLHEIRGFVDRFYETILGRGADPAGRNNWVDDLHTGVRSGADVARGFIGSAEFVGRNTSSAEFVETLYAAFFDRPADKPGFDLWNSALSKGTSRAEVLEGFIGSREFANLSNSFGIRAEASLAAGSNAAVISGNPLEPDFLRGGVGANAIHDGGGVLEAGADEVKIAGQVFRLYGATLARTPDADGFLAWSEGLAKPVEIGGITIKQAAGGFANSAEFRNTYGALDSEGFVDLLYRNVLGREADAGGLAGWTARLDGGMSRAEVVIGFAESQEYQAKTNPALDTFMRTIQPRWNDVIEGGAGNDRINGGLGADVLIFRKGEGGSDMVHGFEPWDELQLSGFGYDTAAQVRARMKQSDGNVVFSDQGQVITFLNTSLSDMSRVRYNLS